MKVLITAYACCPGMGSEPGVGWNRAIRAAQHHDVWVLTREKNREPIERWKPPNLHPVYIDLPKWARFWKRGRVARWVYYYVWQVLAFRRAKRMHQSISFDMAHHVTLASWRVPAFLWMLGIPFIWGPLGGGQSAPRGLFLRSLGVRAWAGEVFRQAFQCLSRLDPLVRMTARRARLVLSANSSTASFIESAFGIRTITILETGIATDRYGISAVKEKPDRRRLRVLWVGSLEPRKNLPMLLKAFAAMRCSVDFRTTIVGDGPERRRWERLCEKLGLADVVQFAGQLPYDETQRQYLDADVFVFTSLRDTSGNVLLEAMASALPVVCLKCGGPADIMNEDCGIMIEPRSEAYVIGKLAEAIGALARDPELRCRMGQAARKRVEEEFSWDALGKRMNSIYQAATNS